MLTHSLLHSRIRSFTYSCKQDKSLDTSKSVLGDSQSAVLTAFSQSCANMCSFGMSSSWAEMADAIAEFEAPRLMVLKTRITFKKVELYSLIHSSALSTCLPRYHLPSPQYRALPCVRAPSMPSWPRSPSASITCTWKALSRPRSSSSSQGRTMFPYRQMTMLSLHQKPCTKDTRTSHHLTIVGHLLLNRIDLTF